MFRWGRNKIILSVAGFCAGIFLSLITSKYENTYRTPKIVNILEHLPKKNINNYEYPPSILLWTTWRSGSTFIGSLLAEASENTFYSYEPMMPLGVRIHRNDTQDTRKAVQYLSDVLHCNHWKQGDIVRHLRHHSAYMNQNKLLNSACRPVDRCSDPSFISSVCRNSSIHVTKVLRLALTWASELLEDPTLNLKIIYVTRDPRALIRSRRNLSWCRRRRPDCRDPSTVCKHISKDLQDAHILAKKHPTKFRFLRYEDFSLDVIGQAKVLWKFLGMDLSQHQLQLIQNRSSLAPPANLTARRSKYNIQKESVSHTFEWRSLMDYSSMKAVQDVCVDALDALGLRVFADEEEYRDMGVSVLV